MEWIRRSSPGCRVTRFDFIQYDRKTVRQFKKPFRSLKTVRQFKKLFGGFKSRALNGRRRLTAKVWMVTAIRPLGHTQPEEFGRSVPMHEFAGGVGADA